MKRRLPSGSNSTSKRPSTGEVPLLEPVLCKRCTGCMETRWNHEYSQSQWSRQDGYHYCKPCVLQKVEAGTPLQCLVCYVWKAEKAFRIKNAGQRLVHRVCEDCVERRPCTGCGEKLLQESFTLGEWKKATGKHKKRGKCKACARRKTGCWACAKC